MPASAVSATQNNSLARSSGRGVLRDGLLCRYNWTSRDEGLPHSTIEAFDWAAGNRMAFGMALGLVCLMAIPFALGQLFLLAGGRISTLPATLILGIAGTAALAAAWRVSGRWLAPVAVAVLAVAAITASAAVIDTSYDGQQYHFDAINALAQGWNPYRDAKPEPFSAELIDHLDAWVSHYPQGAWISSALQMAVGLSLEASKSQALLALMALALASFGIARRMGLGMGAGLLVAFVAASNPVLLVQLFSRMNDGLLGACLALMAIFSVLAILRPSPWAWLGAACPLVLALNLKFSALPLAAAICGMLVLFAWWARGLTAALRSGGVLMALGLLGGLAFGAHPYITNTVGYGHPFYPVMGENKIDIMEINRPINFRAMSPVERIAASYFGATASGYWPPDEHLKAPFSLYKTELRAMGAYDTRIAGFGPFFSGGVVIAFGLAAAASLQRRRPQIVTGLLAAACGTIVLGLVIPEAWWARYVPHVWWGIAMIGLATLMCRPKWMRLGGGILLAVMLVNSTFVAASSALYVGERNQDVRRQFTAIASSIAPICFYAGELHARLSLISNLQNNVRLQRRPLDGCVITSLGGNFPTTRAGFCQCP